MRPEFETTFEPKLQSIVNFHFFNNHAIIGSVEEWFKRREMKRWLKSEGYPASEVNEAIKQALEEVN